MRSHLSSRCSALSSTRSDGTVVCTSCSTWPQAAHVNDERCSLMTSTWSRPNVRTQESKAAVVGMAGLPGMEDANLAPPYTTIARTPAVPCSTLPALTAPQKRSITRRLTSQDSNAARAQHLLIRESMTTGRMVADRTMASRISSTSSVWKVHPLFIHASCA